jgi:hypothetical protein
MSENDINERIEETPVTSKSDDTASSSKKSLVKLYVVAILVVAVVILGVLYRLEKEGRSPTTMFSSVIASQLANEAVATIDGEKITNKDLDRSVEQFKQMAAQQGVDVNDPKVQAEIREQALNVIVNTKLLVKEAGRREITTTDEAVKEKIESIKTDIGGEDKLKERMQALGVDDQKLYDDVREELLITTLLDQIRAESDLSVTDEEVAQLYNEAGSVETGLPPLSEVSEQIKAQIVDGKEQDAINKFLEELKLSSEVTIVGE